MVEKSLMTIIVFPFPFDSRSIFMLKYKGLALQRPLSVLPPDNNNLFTINTFNLSRQSLLLRGYTVH